MILLERKQVGTLYHFTKFENLLGIIDSNGLLNGEHNYISFTRNYDLVNLSRYFEGHSVRLTFDGDKLSDKFKVEPYLDKGWVDRDDNEQEERILWPRFKVLPCMFALKRIDVLNSVRITSFDKENLGKVKLPIFFVSSFSPVRLGS